MLCGRKGVAPLFGLSGEEQATAAAVRVAGEGHTGSGAVFGLGGEEGAGAAVIPIVVGIPEVVTGWGHPQ